MNDVLVTEARFALAAATLLLLAGRTARAYGLPFEVARASCWGFAVLGAAASAVAAQRGGAGWGNVIAISAACVSGAVDAQTGLVFDRVLIPVAALLVAVSAAHGRLEEAVGGAVSGAAMLALPLAASRGRGMGWGDVKLAGVLGLSLGWAGAAVAIAIAFCAGGVVAAALLAARAAGRKTAIPFAPFLALGACCAILR